jgi:hypothetical protein
MRNCGHFRNPSCAELVRAQPKSDNLVDNRAWNLWKITQSSEIAKRRLSRIFWSTLWRKSSLVTDGLPITSLFIAKICSPAHLWTFYTIGLQFTHYILAVHHPRWISAAFMFLAWRKRITEQISQLTGLSIAEHIITHSIETRTNTRWPVIWWLTRQWVTWRYLACASSPPLLL